MSEEIRDLYFAWRRTGANGDVSWLMATLDGYNPLNNVFYKKQSYQRVEWKIALNATWFETKRDAERRGTCKAIKRDAENKTRARWDLVEVQLVMHTKVVKTTADDVVTKLGLLAEVFVA